MKALLKLITTKEHAYNLLKIADLNDAKVLHKKHEEELTRNIIAGGGFSINFGGYGSFSNLGLGDNFHSKWYLDGSFNKQFSKVLVNIDNNIDKDLVKKITSFIEKNDGEIVTKDLCNLYITKSSSNSAKENSKHTFINVSVDELIRRFPLINPKPKKVTQKLSSSTKAAIKDLQKRDLNQIEKTIKDLLSNQEEIDSILSSVSVNEEGEIERGTHFKGTKPALSFTDLGLLKLLSISSDNSKGYEIRNSIREMDITVQEMPTIKGFNSLENLTITIINKNELIKKDLSSFGEFKSLKTLNIKLDKSVLDDLRPSWSGEDKKVVISSLDGLNAPNLEILNAIDLGISNIKALNDCKELLHISFDNNYELEDIDPIKNCSKLQILNLNKISVNTLIPLRELSSLEIISISDCNSLNNLKGLENLNLKITDININKENKDFDESSLSRLNSLVSIENLPKLKTKKLQIREVNISNLKGVESSNLLEELYINNTISLNDINALSDFKKLKKTEISSCPNIQDYSVLAELVSLETCFLGDRYSINEKAKDNKLDILPKKWPETLKFLRLSTSAICLGDLPKNLENIELNNCTNLKSLKELKLCSKLNESYSSGFYNENQINLSSCPSLINLEGLENKPHINKIFISPYITNLDAISDKDDLEIAINFEKFDGLEEISIISKDLCEGLSKLKNFKMSISKGYYAGEVEDISNISSLKNVESLDLDNFYIEDLNFITSMENLKYIRLQANELTRSLKKRVFDTEGQIAKLKMKILSS